MKKILITGENSYVGIKLKKWLINSPDRYLIESISLRGDSWKSKHFSNYDVVIHTAGIAHIKETKENANLYYKVNRDLAYEVAQKAKIEGVVQFVFLSSMSVYGIDSGVIDKSTPLLPKSNYGKSKLQAEELITTLADDSFKVAVLRPPMIYGKECKGNYVKLSNLAVKTPIFPDIDNKRSMIYIDNFSEFVKYIIDNCSYGLFFPQNEEYVKTSKMVRLIAEEHGKAIYMTKLLNPILKSVPIAIINKVFGNLVYDKSLSRVGDFQQVNFEESIKLTES